MHSFIVYDFDEMPFQSTVLSQNSSHRIAPTSNQWLLAGLALATLLYNGKPIKKEILKEMQDDQSGHCTLCIGKSNTSWRGKVLHISWCPPPPPPAYREEMREMEPGPPFVTPPPLPFPRTPASTRITRIPQMSSDGWRWRVQAACFARWFDVSASVCCVFSGCRERATFHINIML